MLVLSRKSSEKIHIGSDITLTVVRIGPNTVRLGIDAPGHMNIVRDELESREPPSRQKLAIPKCADCGQLLGDDDAQVNDGDKVYHLECAPDRNEMAITEPEEFNY